MHSTRVTRCPIQSQDSPFVFKLSLPSRTFRSFGIIALRPIPNSKACLCESPDLPSLPVALIIITYFPRYGSTFRIRYFPPARIILLTSSTRGELVENTIHAAALPHHACVNESDLGHASQSPISALQTPKLLRYVHLRLSNGSRLERDSYCLRYRPQVTGSQTRRSRVVEHPAKNLSLDTD
jgi:hypothetical protein